MDCAAFGYELTSVNQPDYRHATDTEQRCGLLRRDRRICREDDGVRIGFEHLDQASEGRKRCRRYLWRAVQHLIQGCTQMLRRLLCNSSSHDGSIPANAQNAQRPLTAPLGRSAGRCDRLRQATCGGRDVCANFNTASADSQPPPLAVQVGYPEGAPRPRLSKRPSAA